MTFNNSVLDSFNNPNFKILTKVPDHIPISYTTAITRKACIIDLETTGLDYKVDKITEIGIIQFSFSESLSIGDVLACYTSLQDPEKPLSNFITKLTGLSDKDLKGKSIDWILVENLIRESEFVICHNADFDRKFLETDVPDFVKKTVSGKPFACSKNDINWMGKGIQSDKLEFINFKLGFFYSAHRAINDCWAVYNIIQKQSALSLPVFPELYSRLGVTDYVILAEGNVTKHKDLLLRRRYQWSDGSQYINEVCWYRINNDLAFEVQFLREKVYEDKNKQITYYELDSVKRYSTAKLTKAEIFK